MLLGTLGFLENLLIIKEVITLDGLMIRRGQGFE